MIVLETVTRILTLMIPKSQLALILKTDNSEFEMMPLDGFERPTANYTIPLHNGTPKVVLYMEPSHDTY
jgi:hypothetical protein